MKEKIDELKNMLLDLVSEPDLYNSQVEGFKYVRRNLPTEPQYCLYNPIVILILQGEKEVIGGTEKYRYTAGDCVISSINIPTTGRIVKATKDEPFLALMLELNNSIIADFISQMSDAEKCEISTKSMEVMPAENDLLNAFLHLLELEKNPERQKVIAPMIIKEIHYILLTSPFKNILKSINTKGTPANQIANAITWLKDNYKENLSVKELSKKFNMTESSFYRHFNRITTLSPLQYQKQLRLNEAKRLMLSNNINVSNTAYEVGYESVSQFNREYKKFFGIPPKASIKQLKRVANN